MISKMMCVVSVLLFSSSFAFAAGPCAPIRQACIGAGFVKGQVKQGTGLWVDCMCPILNGTAQPAKAKIKLPAVDAGVISACKAKHPNICHGKK